MADCVIEIVEVGLVVGLELMEEIKEVEREYSVWLDNGRGKPVFLKQLLAAVGRVFRVAYAIADDNLMDTGDIKNGHLTELGWVWARLTSWVAELDDEAKGGKGLSLEVLAVPLL